MTSAGRQLKLYNPTNYLQEEPDLRQAQFTSFILNHLDKLENSWTNKDIERINQLVNEYRLRLGSNVASHKLERFIIEFSCKSSKIEGSTTVCLTLKS